MATGGGDPRIIDPELAKFNIESVLVQCRILLDSSLPFDKLSPDTSVQELLEAKRAFGATIDICDTYLYELQANRERWTAYMNSLPLKNNRRKDAISDFTEFVNDETNDLLGMIREVQTLRTKCNFACSDCDFFVRPVSSSTPRRVNPTDTKVEEEEDDKQSSELTESIEQQDESLEEDLVSEDKRFKLVPPGPRKDTFTDVRSSSPVSPPVRDNKPVHVINRDSPPPPSDSRRQRVRPETLREGMFRVDPRLLDREPPPDRADVKMNIPKFRLLTFDGTNEAEWKTYWESFLCTIHNTNLPDIQKMNHLVNSLKGSARLLVSGYVLCNSNYEIAKAAVEERFGDPKVQLRVLRTQLRNWRYQSGRDPRVTVDNLEHILVQLEMLGEDVSHYTFVEKLLKNLPEYVLDDLELHRSNAMKGTNRDWEMPQLRKHLRRFVNSKHRIQVQAQKTKQDSGGKGKKRSGPRMNVAIVDEVYDPDAFSEQESVESSESEHDSVDSDHSETKVVCAVANLKKKKKPAAKPNKFGQKTFKGSSSNSVTPSSSAIKAKPKFPCLMCDQPHFADKCTTYKELSERVARFREKEKCFTCGKSGHMSKNCPDRKKLTCFICKRSGHHRVLCRKLFNLPFKPFKREFKPKVSVNKADVKEDEVVDTFSDLEEEYEQSEGDESDPDADAISQNFVHSLSVNMDVPAVMLTANTKIRNAITKKETNVNLFLDTGGARSFLSTKTAEKLRLSGKEDNLSLYTFGSNDPIPIKSELISFELYLKATDEWVPIVANTATRLSSTFHTHPFSNEDVAAIKDLGLLANDKVVETRSFTPNLMLGVGYVTDFMDNSGKDVLPSGLSTIPSKLGHLIGGNVKEPDVSSNAIIPLNKVTVSTNDDLQKLLNDYFSIESIGIHDSGTDADDDRAILQFENSICADSLDPNRLSCGWPKNDNFRFLQDNLKACIKRFFLLNSKFLRNPKLFISYRKVIRQQLELGIIELVTAAMDAESKANGHVIHNLPHHAVVKETRTTSKVRVVYDASCKSGRNALSLNDCLYKGPTMLPDLCGMLFRFRFYRYILLSDLEKAFLMVGLNPEDRDVTRFLWYKDDEKPVFRDDNIATYRFTRVIFGVLSSPYLLNHTIKYCLSKEGSETAKLIANNIYVDNLLLNIDGPEDGLKIYHETKKIFSDIRMNATAWNTNCEELMKQIPVDDTEPGEVHKVLGLQWDVPTDTIHVSLSYSGENPSTKRQVLKYVASIYDPLGLFAPVLLPAKIFMQKLCNLKHTWDIKITEDLQQEWDTIQAALCNIPEFKIPRHAGPDSRKNIQVDLHAFVDASVKAYATIVYCRVEFVNNVIVHFVIAKTRISPIVKTLTLPRLELLANLIGKRAIDYVARELHIAIREKVLWTDSEICLHWVKSNKVLSTFVANRVREITATDDIQFRYIGTADNPADVTSRGCNLDDLKETDNYNKYFYGPSWLKSPQDQWPEGNIPPIHANLLDQLNNEVKKTAVPFMLAGVKRVHVLCIDPSRFSSLQKMRNTTVYVLRFVGNLIDSLRDKKIKRSMSLQFQWSTMCKNAEKILIHINIFIWDKRGRIPIEAIEYQYADWETRTRLDGMSLGGDIHFCNQFTCTEKAKFFCWFPSRNRIILSPSSGSHTGLASSDNIPLLAWGMDSLQFYPFKDAEKVKQLPTCSACSLTCIIGGIQVNLKRTRYLAINPKKVQYLSQTNDHTFFGRSLSFTSRLFNVFSKASPENINANPSGYHLVEACLEPFCYQIHSPSEEVQFYFPGESTISPYKVTVKVWSHGVVVSTMHTSCQPHPFCEKVDCIFCSKLMMNPSCMPKTVIFIILAIIYLMSISSVCFYYLSRSAAIILIKFPRCLCHICYNSPSLYRKMKRRLYRCYRMVRDRLRAAMHQRQRRAPAQEEIRLPLIPPTRDVIEEAQNISETFDAIDNNLNKIIDISHDLDGIWPKDPPEEPPEFFYVDGERQDRDFRSYSHVMIKPKIMSRPGWELPLSKSQQRKRRRQNVQFICEIDTGENDTERRDRSVLPAPIHEDFEIISESTHQPEVPSTSRQSQPVAISTRPTSLNLTNLMIFGLICCLPSISHACVEFTLLQATMDECSLNERNVYECNINQVSRLALAPQNGDACLLVKNPLDEVIGSLYVHVKSIRQLCRKRTLYYTRSYYMQTLSSKRCSGAGSCYEGADACEKYQGKTEFGISELHSIEDYPGQSQCSASCGCAACGCGLCTSSCLFYRYYALPLDTSIYHVFECALWTPFVDVTMRFLDSNNSTVYDLRLYPGIKTSEAGIDLTLISTITPQSPILSQKIITDGRRYASVDASPPGGNLVGLIGSLQCSTRAKAARSNMNGCTLPLTPCSCTELSSKAICRCMTTQIDDMFLDEQKALPLSMYGFTLLAERDEIYAQYADVSAYELQLQLKGKKLASQSEKYQCTVEFLSLSGCFNCLSGAVARYLCRSSHGETVANVFCSFSSGQDVLFSAVCAETPVELTSKLAFDRAIIDVTCKVRCTGGTTAFRMYGNLAFIENIRYGNITAAISSTHHSGNDTQSFWGWIPALDFGIFSQLFSGNWLITILGIGLVILLIFLSIQFGFPCLIAFCARNNRTSKNVSRKRSSPQKTSSKQVLKRLKSGPKALLGKAKRT